MCSSVCYRVPCRHIKYLSCCAQLMKSSDTTSATKKVLTEGPSLKDFLLLSAKNGSQSNSSASEVDSFVPYVKQQDYYGNNRRGNTVISKFGNLNQILICTHCLQLMNIRLLLCIEVFFRLTVFLLLQQQSWICQFICLTVNNSCGLWQNCCSFIYNLNCISIANAKQLIFLLILTFRLSWLPNFPSKCIGRLIIEYIVL